jgi:hypothetical protein
MPDNRLLNQLGLGGFFSENMAGITMNDTYCLLPSVAGKLRVYFHELDSRFVAGEPLIESTHSSDSLTWRDLQPYAISIL